MGFLEENGNSDVYKHLTKPDNAKTNQRWTLYLVLCCMTVSLGSFQFGYNLGSMNLITPIVKNYFEKVYFKELFYDKLEFFRDKELLLINGTKRYNAGVIEYNNGVLKYTSGLKNFTDGAHKRNEFLPTLFGIDNKEESDKAKKEKAEKEKEIREKYNMTLEEFFPVAKKKLQDGVIKLSEGYEKLSHAKIKLENGSVRYYDGIKRIKEGKKKIDFVMVVTWGFTNSLFVIGGLIGALTSKYVMDYLGRKNGIVFHYIFSIIGSMLLFTPQFLHYYSKAGPILVKLGRFFQGIQGGMTCSIIPTYLSEIAPCSLRGQAVVIHNLFLTFGLFMAQFLSFDFIFGQESYWNYLLAFPILPAVIGGLVLIIFFDESPKFLLFERSDEDSAVRALQKFRNEDNVSTELTKMYVEGAEMSSQNNMSIKEVLMAKELRGPLFAGIVLQFAQQFCGMNAVFFYLQSILERAGVHEDYFQVGVLLTGLTNVICTFFCMKIVDRLGRKPLLLGTMVLMAFDLLLLTTFLRFSNNNICAILALSCFLAFIIFFAVGLGPIPFIFVTEAFKQNSRSSAVSICVFCNWFFNLFLILFFPVLNHLIGGYVFIIFAIIIICISIYIFICFPETKGRSAEEIYNLFNKNKKMESQYDLKNEIHA